MTGSNWQNFETEVAEAFGREVAQFRTALNPRLATVRRKPGYYSRDRDGNIVFDVAVEVCEPGATEPSLRWVIECKDFPRRKVTVDDVEEFIQKLDQVGIGNIRGSMVTRVGYQEAAFRLANSRRIGLYTLNKELLRVTAYSSRPSVPRHMIVSCTGGCLPSGDLITPSSELNLFTMTRSRLYFGDTQDDGVEEASGVRLNSRVAAEIINFEALGLHPLAFVGLDVLRTSGTETDTSATPIVGIGLTN